MANSSKQSYRKTIGLVGLAVGHHGGILQYSRAVFQRLLTLSEYRFVLFLEPGCTAFEDIKVETRILENRKTRFIETVRFLSLLADIPAKRLITRKERRMMEDIDLFYSPIISTFPSFFCEKPFVFTLHDLQEKYFPEFFPFFERLKRHLVNFRLANRAFRIVCESEAVKRDIIHFLGIQDDKIRVIPAPPMNQFLNISESGTDSLEIVRRKYELPRDFLFYPAQFWPHKNHKLLFEALKLLHRRFPELKLILTGSKGSALEQLEALARDLGLSNSVAFLGYLPTEELMGIYRLSKMLVMPSLFESISIPIFEAFSLKVPVVCSNVTSLPDQIGDAGLLFDPHSVDDLAAKIEMLLQDPDLARDLGKKGYIRITSLDKIKLIADMKYIFDEYFHS